MTVWYETFENGELRELRCSACGLPAQKTTHPDGRQTLICPCGRTSMTMLAEGELDLGIVVRDPDFEADR